MRFVLLMLLVGLIASCAKQEPATSVPTAVSPTNIALKPTNTAIVPTATSQASPTTAATPSATPRSASEIEAMTQALIQAAENGDIATMQRLLVDGANINGQDDRGRTAVMAATHGRQVEAVRTLIDAGADINIRDHRSDNPFLYAGAEGLLEILQLTIEANADPTLTNRFGGTALIPACERGHVEIVRELLTRTAVDVNHVNNLGWTGLLEAIILSDGGARHQEIVQLLMDYGANVNIADKDGVTPLHHAQRRGYSNIEQILLDTIASRNAQLITAADQGDLETVKRLVAIGTSVEARDPNGRTALIAAAYRNDLPIVDVLIAAGADVNAKDQTQQSAYLIATSDGFLELLQRTFKAGADVHSTDSFNGTGLIRAAERGHVEIVQELLKTDIKIDHVNNLGWTALLEAIMFGNGDERHTEVVRLLVEAGANVNLADREGETPLSHARRRGYQNIVVMLEKAGAR